MTHSAGPDLSQAAPDAAAAETAPRRRVAARTRLDFWFDAVLLVALAMDPVRGPAAGALAAGPEAAMRFLRHLAAVALTVTIVIALGVAWSHGNGSGRPAQPPARQVVEHRRDGFNLGNPQDLERTILIEAVLAGLVITVSRARRRRRQARRTLSVS